MTKKYKERYMKKIFIIIGIIVCLCFIVRSKTVNKYWNKFLKFADYMECVEDGICDEGVVVGTGENQYVVSKETCLEHKGEWNGTSCKLY